MHLGVAGPVTLASLKHLVRQPETVPPGYAFPNTASLVIELMARGHSISVFALDSTIDEPSVHRGDNLTIYVSPMRSRARHRARDLFAVERRGLARAIEMSGCDLVHAHWTYEFALGAQEAGLPHVVTAHDAPLNIARLNRHPYWWIRAAMAGVAIHRTETMTAVAPNVAAHLSALYRYRRPISVIPNGIPADIFERDVTRSHSNTPLFVSVSQGWSPLKNVRAAIDAFTVLRGRHRDARLLLFGAGHGHGEEAERYAIATGKSEGCQFLGAVPRTQLIDVLAGGITALVHPSRYEAHSVAVAEAMALGICVIGGRNSGGIPWTLAYGNAGLLADINNPESIASAMATVTEDSKVRQEYATAARKHASMHYALPVVAGQYEAIYSQVLASR